MKNFRPLLPVGYALGFLLILVPLSHVVTSGVPPRPGLPVWRFTVLGSLTGSLALPTLGLVLAAFTAYALNHRLAFRGVAVLSLLAALGLLPLTGLLALDALQLRRQVAPDMRVAYDVNLLRGEMLLFLFAVVLGWFGYRAARLAWPRHPDIGTIGGEEGAPQQALGLWDARAKEAKKVTSPVED